MRVYNGTNSQVDLPLAGDQRITISSHSVSKDIMPSTEFLSLLVSSYDYNELALIVSGPFEINMCSGVSGCVGFVCQSLEEAIERFQPKVENTEDKKEEVNQPEKEETTEKEAAENTTSEPQPENKDNVESNPEAVEKDNVVEEKVENKEVEDIAAKIKKLKKLRAANKKEDEGEANQEN